jgi:hypothetical protein
MAEDLSVSSRLERLLHFVTSHSARDVPKVGIGHEAGLVRHLWPGFGMAVSTTTEYIIHIC